MKLFKQRLKESLISGVQFFGLFIAVIGFVVLLMTAVDKYVMFEKTVLVLVVALLGGSILLLISRYVYWMFIEPFKKNKEGDRDER